MGNKVKILGLVFFAFLNIEGLSQSSAVMDFVDKISNDIYLVRIIKIDTCQTVSPGVCKSAVKAEVIRTIKRHSIVEGAKIINFEYRVGLNADMTQFSRERMPKESMTYYIFLNTTDNELAKAKNFKNTTQLYGLVDFYFGLIEFNRDVEKYFELKYNKP